MITDKSSFSKFPLVIKVKFKRKNWYLFPQGWAWIGCFSEVSYQRTDGDFDIWEENHFRCYKGYAFSWLFIHVTFDLRREKGNLAFVMKKELRIPDMSKL
jgi:hypothetical protein